MIKDSAKRNFDLVIVWKLDRFARDRYDSAHYKAALRKNGVKVISATEKISEGSEGILMEAVLRDYSEQMLTVFCRAANSLPLRNCQRHRLFQ